MSNRLYVMVDVEADGPIPGDYSMVAIGAVIVEPELKRTFRGLLHPISDRWDPQALAVSGYSRAETWRFDDPKNVMSEFALWISRCQAQFPATGRPIFIADNNGFDWGFVNWYFHHFYGSNPFGFSSTNLGSLYKGMYKDLRASFKHLRKTRHTHDPVDDAMGNAEALLAMQEMGLKL